MKTKKILMDNFTKCLRECIWNVLCWYLGYSCAVERNDNLSFALYASLLILFLMIIGTGWAAFKAFRGEY